MLRKILLLILVFTGVVVSILDPNYHVRKKAYDRNVHITQELLRHHEITSRHANNNPRLSSQRYQESGTVEPQERHANRNRQDYANNIDDYYGGCPSGYTGQIPYPYDCRRFVNCWKGRAFIQTCGPGTVFNALTSECDDPTKVVCEGLSAQPKARGEQLNQRSGRFQTVPSNANAISSNNAVSCPSGFTGLMPHPNDCSKFLNCASGSMHVQSCGPQTMFNSRTKVCDFTHKVDCSGREVGSNNSPTVIGGNRNGKTFEINARDNQPVEPQRKGWPTHSHNHHHFHQHHQHQFNSGHGSFTHHHHDCSDPSHNHPTPQPAQAPIFFRDRWSSMNRTRPSASSDKPSWQPTITTPNPQQSWTPNSWRPMSNTNTKSTSRNWKNHGGFDRSAVTTTISPPSNYPSVVHSLNPTGTDTTTEIIFAQPLANSEEVFSNINGADIFEISLPSNRHNSSRGIPFHNIHHSIQFEPEPTNPSMDAINIPNLNLMPPLPSSPNDDRQFQIPDQFPNNRGRFTPNPNPTPKPSQRPNTVNFHPSSHVDDLSKDVINIPKMDLMPPFESSSNDDRQYQIPEKTPDFSSSIPQSSSPGYHRPSSHTPPDITISSVPPNVPSSGYPRPVDPLSHTNPDIADSYSGFSSFPSNIPHLPSPGNRRPVDPISHTRPDISDSYPDFSAQRPSYSLPDHGPSQSTNRSDPGSSNQNPSHLNPTPIPNENPIYDESNLFGGMLPPLPSASETNSWDEFTPLQPPSTPTTPLQHSFTTPVPGVKNNVRVFQIFPPLSLQNATTKVHPSPFYSPSYSGVAHSRNTSWQNWPVKGSNPIKTTPKPVVSTTPTVPTHDFQPDITFSLDGGVVVQDRINHLMSPETNQRHGSQPPNYNREFYKQTTPSNLNREPISDDNDSQMPISEAIKLLLRPYINRSGTVTDDMVSKAESHIMNLSQPKEHSTTSTTTSTVAPEVEIIFAGEQNELSSPSYDQPIHSHVLPISKYHQHHDISFHRQHPELPNPFKKESGPGIESRSQVTTTSRTPDELTTQVEVYDPTADDVCEFDCGDGQCVKTFVTCDGVKNCANGKDEEKCDFLGYEIRLSNEGYGRVEVKILGQWGYVCDDKFGIADANVVCRELGFPLGASDVHGNSFYPPTEEGEVSFVMDEVDCSGNETSLKDCPFMGWGVSDCGPEEVVGVQCKTQTMKCPNDYWLCNTSKECIPPAFVCDNVPDCTDQSDESPGVCNSTIEFRLRGGKNNQEGRLEVLYHAVWGTICDDDFGQTEAQVACNSLGFYGPAKIVKNAFGPGSGPIWLDQLSCFGNETVLNECNHWSWGEHNCNHTEDVSIKCTTGSPPRSNNNAGVKGYRSSSDDDQTTSIYDIGLDIYPMERSSKFENKQKICGHFNSNLTEELPNEFERVVKGNVAKRGHHPWQATIRTKGRGGISSHWCGAVLISKKHLLTAAHCLVGYPKGAYFIRLGDHYANIAESSEFDSFIENWYIHEKFREGTHMNNDIALIVMKNPVRFNDYIQPICLPQEGTEYKEGRRCTISGWGSVQSGVSTPSNHLRVAEIPVISDDICKLPHVYGNSVTEGMFCAGFLEEGVDACEGDSGGPFVCSDSDAETLYGIISWGQQCGRANKPGVYVRIEKYLDWIYEKIRFSMQQTN